MTWPLVVALVLAETLGLSRHTRQMPLIIGGFDAENEEFPFQVSISKWGQHFCGGTIINEEWILTAAHCVDNEEPSDLHVAAGSTLLFEEGVRKQVDHYTMHPRYNESDAYKNDIAVIKLTSPLTFTADVQPVALPVTPRKATPSGLKGTAIGWGLLRSDGEVSDELQKVDLVTYDAATCQKAYSGYTHHNNFCAGVPDGGKAQCKGDSGGPFLIDGVQVGIVSWSAKPCGSSGFPGVFTEVSFFLAWIRRETGRTSKTTATSRRR